MSKRKQKRMPAKKPGPKTQTTGAKVHAAWCDVTADADGAFGDLFVKDGAAIHIEQMDTGSWWIGIYKDDQRQVVWFDSDSPIRARTERDT